MIRKTALPVCCLLVMLLVPAGPRAGDAEPGGRSASGSCSMEVQAPASPGPGTVSSARGLFVENHGQWDRGVRYVARLGPSALLAGEGAFSAVLWNPASGRGGLVRFVLEGGSGCRPRGEERGPGVFNFLLAGRRYTGVPGYASVLYEGIRPGVDLRLRRDAGRFEYDLLLEPGADLSGVVIRCEGARSLEVKEGELLVGTAFGELRQPLPRTWEVLPCGRRRPVACSFRVIGEEAFGFSAPGRDRDLPLVVDPGLVWSGFLGGSGWESAYDADAGPGGGVVVGQTGSSNFPTTPGAFDPGFNGFAFSDVFVTRLAADGSALLWSTFIGGTSGDCARAVVLDDSGEVVVAGTTTSGNFPTTSGAWDTSLGGGSDAFVLRLDAGGSALLFSTFVGGSGPETGEALALDGNGRPHVAGTTSSADFPAGPGALDTTLGGTSDAFVLRLDAAGAQREAATLLGGSDGDTGAGVAVGPQGELVLAGTTSSTDFPTTPNAHDGVQGGNSDAWVAVVDATGSSLVHGTFLGGSGGDSGEAVACDGAGTVWAAGVTSSGDFPATSGALDTTLDGNSDAFVAAIDPGSGGLLAATLLGGSSGDVAKGVGLDGSGAVVLAGVTSSGDFPTTPGAHDRNQGGSGDGFVARISGDAGQLHYATFLGGSNGETLEGLGLDGIGRAAVAGTTSSNDFTLTPGWPDTTSSGPAEAFAALLELLPAGATRYGRSTPGCAGSPSMGVSGVPQVGNAGFALTAWNAPPGATGVLGFSPGALSTPLVLSGLEVWVDIQAPGFGFLTLQADAAGTAAFPAPLPSDPSLANLQVHLQSVWPDACAPSGLAGSHGLTVTIQP